MWGSPASQRKMRPTREGTRSASLMQADFEISEFSDMLAHPKNGIRASQENLSNSCKSAWYPCLAKLAELEAHVGGGVLQLGEPLGPPRALGAHLGALLLIVRVELPVDDTPLARVPHFYVITYRQTATMWKNVRIISNITDR